MIYNIGDILICKKQVCTLCLEATNPEFEIMPGDRYIVTDKDEWPDDHHCKWYELNKEGTDIFLNAWNDKPDHMIIDDSFKLEERKGSD